jgi:CheY-like chemotaxis protein
MPHIIGAIAILLWVLLAALAVWLLRQPLTAAVSILASFEAAGVKFALSGGAALDAAIKLAAKSRKWPVEVPAADRKAALDRANTSRSVFEGADILWVDNRPSNNAAELWRFDHLRRHDHEALEALKAGGEQHHVFDLILFDISRELPTRDMKAGLAMLPRLRDAGHHHPVIYYIGNPDADCGVPPGAFGLTNLPDQPLQLVIDASARVRRKA